jgi:hypothetical protein
MSTDTEANKHPSRTRVEDQTKRRRRVVRTTLGELIVAVTEEVMPFVREPSALYPVVSCIVNDVVARHRLRTHEWSPERYPSCLAGTLH